MNPIRIALGIFLAALIAVPVYSQEESAPPATGAARPMRIRIGNDIAAPTHIVEPEYPADVKITGKVVLHAIIATDGTVSKLDALAGHPILTEAAMDAVKQWRYKPVLLNGQPVEVDTTINVIFALDKKGKLKPQPKHQ